MMSSDSPSGVAHSVRKHLAGSPLDGPSNNPPLLPGFDDLPPLHAIHEQETKESTTSKANTESNSNSSDLDNDQGNAGSNTTLTAMAMRAKTNATQVFQRMTTEASKSMARIGHFNDDALSGTRQDSVAGYFFGDDVDLDENNRDGNGDRRDGSGSGGGGGAGGDGASDMRTSLLHNSDGAATAGDSNSSSIRPASLLNNDGSLEQGQQPQQRQQQQQQHHYGSIAQGNTTTTNKRRRGQDDDEETPLTPVLLSTPTLVNHDQLPTWFEPYSYTYTGYRLHYNPALGWNSIWQCHNETQNIWSEFLPMLLFVIVIVWMLEDWSVVVDAPALDRAFILIACFGCLIVRPAVSGLAHVFHQQSRRNYIVWWSMDYVSICVAITCSSLLFARFTFYCECDRQLFYIIGVVGLLTSTIIAVVSVASPGVRITSFILLVVIANGLPLLLQLYLQFASANEYNVLPWDFMAAWMSSLGIMLFGLIIRGCSIPEVCCPGCFDYVGHSHSYWHLAINGGFTTMLIGIQKYLSFRREHMCPGDKIDWCNNATFVNATMGGTDAVLLQQL